MFIEEFYVLMRTRFCLQAKAFYILCKNIQPFLTSGYYHFLLFQGDIYLFFRNKINANPCSKFFKRIGFVLIYGNNSSLSLKEQLSKYPIVISLS